MSRRYMLDTNMVSYIVRRQSPAARAKLTNLSSDDVGCISAISEAEIRYGLAKNPYARDLAFTVEAFLGKTLILPWGSAEAALYGQLRVKQEAEGKTLSSLDLLIAAHAVAVSAILVTNDKAFSQVQDLLKTNWATDM